MSLIKYSVIMKLVFNQASFFVLIMPRAKLNSTSSAEPRLKTPRKKVSRATAPKKKIKKVLVDVIADEPLELAAGFSDISSEPEMAPEPEKPAFFQHKNLAQDAPAEIDQQSKFYTRLASEIKERKDKPEAEVRQPRKNLNLYRRLVWKFVILTAVLLAAVAYFSFSQLTVLITPKGEVITDAILLKVSPAQPASALASSTQVSPSDATDPRLPIAGAVQALNVSSSKDYPSSGQELNGTQEQVMGTVTLINNYNKNQALVATTRLLSADNKLFRLVNAVNIPAGGQVTAQIYADKPSQEMAIGPSTFSIPGLWLGLQDKIYARSDQAFVFQQKITKFVNPSDLQAAATDIKNVLLAQAQAQTAALGGDWLYDTSAPATVTFNAKAGDLKDNFMATATAQIIAVSFSKAEALKLAQAKLNLLVPDDKTLTEFKPEDVTYSLESYNPQDGSATVRASFTGTMMLKSDATIIDRSQLLDLNQAQIDNYLRNFPEVESYELHFFPPFIHKAPSLVDRITIKINTTVPNN